NIGLAVSALADLNVPATGLVGDPLTVFTTLTRTSPPPGAVSGANVGFTLTDPASGVSTLSALTTASGQATVAFPSLSLKGAHTVVANFAGDSNLAASTSNTESITVYQRTSLAFAGGSGAAGSPITLTATLTAVPSGAPIQGQFVQFNFGGTPSPLGAVTDASGVATVTPTFPTGGTFSTTAFFSNVVFYFADSTGALVPTTATANVNVTGCVTDPVVLNSGNAGTGSLRQAVIDACAGSTITFGDGSGGGGTNFTDGTADTITTASQITIDKNLTIEGQAANLLSITYSGPFSGVSRVFLVTGGVTATLSKITISGGQVTGGEFGGGIQNLGTLTLANTTVSGNTASGGGGISNSGSLTLNNSTVANNVANPFGGGIYSTGALTVTNSTISGNSATSTGIGGGINNSSGTPGIITNSTISGNSAVLFGGGLYGAFTVTNSTIHGNSTSNAGAGFSVSTGQTLTINNSTIAGNTASGQGGGVQNSGGTVNSSSSIFAGNTATTGPDFSGTLTSQGYNLIGNDAGTTISGGTNDIVNPAGGALLGPLANNGGPTLTQALLPGSPAVDKGINAVVPLTNDQRGAGFARVIDNAPTNADDGTDIGAYEAPLTPTVTSVNPNSGPTAGGNSVVITGTNFTGATVTFDGLACPITGNTGTQITCTAPAHAAGPANVVVTTSGVPSTPPLVYTYEDETTVTLSGGNLTVTDTNGGNSNDNIVIACTPPNITITDSGTGLNQTVPIIDVTGSITVNTFGGNDTLTVNLSGCDFIPAGGLFFNGGETASDDDGLAIVGGSQGTVTYGYGPANGDGTVAMSNFGTITYTGLEPIVNSGTAADVIFNLPAVANVATLADDGIGGNGLSRLSGATFETTDFANPTSSLTINRGTVSDQLLVNAVPELTSSIILGSAAARFNQISIGGTATLGSGNSFSAFALNSVFLTSFSSDVSTTGTGAISLNSARSVSMAAGSSLNSVDGAITLNGNQEAVSTIDNVNGIFMSAALVHATGTGVVTLNGRGG
ncbi:MAG: choice-of-anchor Q domain-containing protein, partial [Pyrinomonadaceae bacterium]